MIKKLLSTAFILVTLAYAPNASAAVVGCSGVADKVVAVTNTSPLRISAKWQDPPGTMQRILSRSITVTAPLLSSSCVVAHFSSLVRIVDNYVAFRVTIDGAPMTGHVNGLAGINQPTVWTSLDDQDEQTFDPNKNIAHNFFALVQPGVHLVEVWAAAGSNIITQPTAYNPVLTLEYR